MARINKIKFVTVILILLSSLLFAQGDSGEKLTDSSLYDEDQETLTLMLGQEISKEAIQDLPDGTVIELVGATIEIEGGKVLGFGTYTTGDPPELSGGEVNLDQDSVTNLNFKNSQVKTSEGLTLTGAGSIQDGIIYLEDSQVNYGSFSDRVQNAEVRMEDGELKLINVGGAILVGDDENHVLIHNAMVTLSHSFGPQGIFNKIFLERETDYYGMLTVQIKGKPTSVISYDKEPILLKFEDRDFKFMGNLILDGSETFLRLDGGKNMIDGVYVHSDYPDYPTEDLPINFNERGKKGISFLKDRLVLSCETCKFAFSENGGGPLSKEFNYRFTEESDYISFFDVDDYSKLDPLLRFYMKHPNLHEAIMATPDIAFDQLEEYGFEFKRYKLNQGNEPSPYNSGFSPFRLIFDFSGEGEGEIEIIKTENFKFGKLFPESIKSTININGNVKVTNGPNEITYFEAPDGKTYFDFQRIGCSGNYGGSCGEVVIDMNDGGVINVQKGLGWMIQGPSSYWVSYGKSSIKGYEESIPQLEESGVYLVGYKGGRAASNINPLNPSDEWGHIGFLYHANGEWRVFEAVGGGRVEDVKFEDSTFNREDTGINGLYRVKGSNSYYAHSTEIIEKLDPFLGAHYDLSPLTPYKVHCSELVACGLQSSSNKVVNPSLKMSSFSDIGSSLISALHAEILTPRSVIENSNLEEIPIN